MDELVNEPLMANELEVIDAEAVAKERALIRKAWVGCLARKSYWKEELRRKLLRKGFSPEAVASEIEECERKGYLDDRAQTERWISKTLAKGQGARALYFYLKQKGVVLAPQDPLHSKIREQEEDFLKALLQRKSLGIRQLLQRGYRYEAIEKFAKLLKIERIT